LISLSSTEFQSMREKRVKQEKLIKPQSTKGYLAISLLILVWGFGIEKEGLGEFTCTA